MMGPVFQMMRQGLAALLACLPLLAVGAGNVAVPASSDPDAALAAVFKDIERSRLSDALEKVDTLIQRYPNFRLAHLIRGDLLLARSRPLPSFGGSPLTILWAFSTIRLSIAWRKTSVSSTTGMTPEAIISCRTLPAPTGGS